MLKPKIKTKPRPVQTEPAHRGMDLDKASAKHKEVEERSSGDLLDLKDGWNFLFLLPPWSEEGVIWKEVEQHGRGVCPKRSVGKECLVCAEMVKRARRGDTDFVENHRLKSRAFFNAVKKENVRKLLSTPDAVVKVLGASGVVFREILEFINDEKVDVSDPNACVTLGIKKTGKGLRTRYKVKFGDPVDISKYVTKKVMECLHNLDAFRFAQPMSIKDQRKLIRGNADEDEDESFEDEEELGEEKDLDEEEQEGAEEGSEEDEVFEEPEGEEDEAAEEGEGAEEDEAVEEDADPEDEPAEDDEGEDELSDEDEAEEEPEPPPRKLKPKAPASKPTPLAHKPKPGSVAAKVGTTLKKKVRKL